MFEILYHFFIINPFWWIKSRVDKAKTGSLTKLIILNYSTNVLVWLKTKGEEESQKKSLPQVKNEVMQVYDEETLALPQGETTVRKVSVGCLAAWYAKNDGMAGLPPPVKFDDGNVVYTLRN